MDVLKKKRKAVRSQATRLTKETDDILAAEEAPTNEKVSVLLERLRLVKQQLNDVDAAIEPNVKDDEAEAEFEQVIEYGDKIATCICRLNLKKEQTEQASKDKEIRFQATVGSASAAQRIKLPKLELTKFDGKRKNWQPFWEQFEVAVHKNTELSNIDRLNYLKTLLTGEAVTAIAGLQASGDCYSDAVDILRQRFGNPEALVQDHMQGLIDVKPVFSARNVRALRGLYDEIQVHMRGLKALGIEDDGYQAMLYPVLLRALPKELILDYHRSHAENQEEATPAVVDDSGSTTSSSDSSQLTPLHSLLRFFRFELESRERTLEDRPDDAHAVTLARLELLAALLASRLYQFVRSNLDMKFDKVFLWTDSMITLSWIRGNAARWKEFVRNRVAEIQQNSETATWRFCPGKSNPADLMTRGLTSTQLKTSELWWNGPQWITGRADVWPVESQAGDFTAEELEKKREVGVLNSTSDKEDELLDLEDFSSASRVNRVTAWIFRFVRNLRSSDRISGPLTAAEIDHAKGFWVRSVQKSAFSAELESTKKRSRIPNDSALKEFALWTDENGLLRIKGRICSTETTLDERHPIVLPKKHRYTSLLVHQAHRQLLHAVELLLAASP
ncbi:hypothetical protein V5799_015934 [Amblyomma americanum]|uniref:Uncharacterized protein n=1 Tax=Amblyomma americanum TaxID=6943 RepID=A0AAQ4F7K9_AMBAM